MENRDLIKNAVKYINNLGSNSTTLDDVAKKRVFLRITLIVFFVTIQDLTLWNT